MNHSLSFIGTVLTVSVVFFIEIQAQQSVGIGTDNPDPHASLEVRSVNSGTLISRMTTGQRNSNITGIGAVQEGLLIYNLTDSEFNYWDGTQWIPFPGGDDDWYEDGTPDSPPDNITDAIFTNGFVGIGVNVPTMSFHIADVSATIQSILVEDLSQTGDAYNPAVGTVSLVNRATVFVDKTTGIMYSEDANRAFWRLDGNALVVTGGYSGGCPNLISGSMIGSGYEYLGTNDDTDFIIATNDRERMRILRDGQLVAYGKGIATPASSPTGCVPAYPVIDAASFYAVDDIYPLNAYSENAPAVYGAATDGGGAFVPQGVNGFIAGAGDGVHGNVGNANGGSVGVRGSEVTLLGWAVLAEGDVGATGGYFIASDQRLKEDIQPFHLGLNTVMQLSPKTYGIKSDYGVYGMRTETQTGFLAQDVQQVLPGLVKISTLPAAKFAKTDPSEYREPVEDILTLNYTGLIPILTSAIQEQQAIIEDLQDENLEIKRRLLAMEEKLFTPPPGRE